jgi:hypothetical protein
MNVDEIEYRISRGRLRKFLASELKLKSLEKYGADNRACGGDFDMLDGSEGLDNMTEREFTVLLESLGYFPAADLGIL